VAKPFVGVIAPAFLIVVVCSSVMGFTGGSTQSGDEPFHNLAQVSAREGESAIYSNRGLASDQGLRLFFETVRVIRESFVGNVSAKEVFKQTAAELPFVVPPNCGEDFPSKAECEQDAEQCFVEAVRAVAICCHTDMQGALFRALNLALRKLDHNSALLDVRMLKELKISTSGKFGGIGMVVTRRDGDYVVVSSIEGSPAFNAGIKPGDAVLAIDGEPIHGLPLMEVLSKVRGQGGSRISLSIKPRGTEAVRQVYLRRTMISIPPVRYHVLDQEIGYLRIVNFQNSTTRDVARALTRMFRSVRGRLQGLILDLRANPGGLFDQAIEVADLFVPHDTITVVKGRHEKLNREFRGKGRDTYPRVPTVVLIDRGTASAAEILAGALKGKPDVVIMGERSFGKASVQGIFPLSNGMGLRLTTAHYYTPDGGDIEGKGIEPDVPAEDAELPAEKVDTELLDKAEIGRDRAVTKAFNLIVSGMAHGPTGFSTLF